MNLARDHKGTPPPRWWDGHNVMSEETLRSWEERKPGTPGGQGFEDLNAEEGLVILLWVGGRTQLWECAQGLSSEHRLEWTNSSEQVLRVYKEPRPPLLSSVL